METVSPSQSTISKRPRLAAATYSAAEVFGLFSIGYTSGMEQVKAGRFPVTPIKVGRQLKFPRAVVDRMLGLNNVPDDAPEQDAKTA